MNKVELNSYLQKYYENSNVLGAIQVGSSSHYYKDINSDYDIEMVVTNEYYQSLDNNKLLVRDDDTKIEILLLSKDNFESKINSTLNINHWPYIRGKLLFDRDDVIRQIIKKISEMDQDLTQRIKLHYFEFILLRSKINRILETGEELNLQLACAQLAIIASKMAFLIQKKWPPIIYWTAQNLQYLENGGAQLKQLLLQVFKEPTMLSVDMLQKGIEKEMQEYGYDFYCDKELLIQEITTNEYLKIREKYSFF